jgi:DNA-binding transcriptional MocR family regulator
VSERDAEQTPWDGLKLNSDSPVPLWAQLGRELRRRMVERSLPVGTPLPSEPALASKYELSRETVRRAYQALVETGQIDPWRSDGYCIAREIPPEYVTVAPGSRITAPPPPDPSEAPGLPWWIVVTLRVEAPGKEPIHFDGTRTVLLVS